MEERKGSPRPPWRRRPPMCDAPPDEPPCAAPVRERRVEIRRRSVLGFWRTLGDPHLVISLQQGVDMRTPAHPCFHAPGRLILCAVLAVALAACGSKGTGGGGTGGGTDGGTGGGGDGG